MVVRPWLAFVRVSVFADAAPSSVDGRLGVLGLWGVFVRILVMRKEVLEERVQGRRRRRWWWW